MLTFHCDVEKIAEWHPQLFLDSHIVACVSILKEYSRSPARLEVECQGIEAASHGRVKECSLVVVWSGETASKAERLRLTMQRKPLVETAAIAIAMVLVHELTDLEELDVTEYGDRADYRSLTAQCMLEISGTESLAELSRRHRQKATQAIANRYGWDAYAIVCAFSARGHRIRFSRHSHGD